MAVTIKQIATIAGVSRATVDKVLNNRAGVKKETKETILKIAKELNYQPNLIGKALVMSKKRNKIGIVMTPYYNPFVQAMLEGVNAAAAEIAPFGLEIETKMMVSLDAGELINILNYFESESFAGVAVFPINDPAVVRKVNRMIADGMPVITFNSPVESIHSICFVGQNHYIGGRVAASLLGRRIRGDGKTAIIYSSRSLSCHTERMRGFRDKLGEAYPGIRIVETLENQDKSEESFKYTMDLCRKYPDLDSIYITSGGVSGICSALDILGLAGRIRVICHDIPAKVCPLLKSGVIDFSIEQNAYDQGYKLVQILFNYLIKGIEPERSVQVPISILTDELV
ncbi:MAG: substrate-binding domain-containing protein [Clostridiales bacterium]|nr:substrate-binding domain-containing protein [Clostridiales bacterium]